MIILTGNSLGERQKDLNEKVTKAEVNAIDQYKTKPAKNDVDNIFLVDLASRTRNLDFILQTLKSGDIVHITRTLNKCTWLSNDEFSHIIHVDNLHKNIFPLMSIKMKKKLLCALSHNMKTESRSISFYEYCMAERLFNIAMKFLFNTSESYKNDIILQKTKGFEMVLSNKEEALANFIGSSFTLAHTLLDNLTADVNRNYVLYLLRYLYPILGEQYLDLMEKYNYIDNGKYWNPDPTRFGRRISKEIIKKHKDRVRKNPSLYLKLLNKEKVAKNSTVSDAKMYAASLIPEEVKTFWDINFYEKYKFFIDIIPAGERFRFIKKIFTEKYISEKFEMSEKFYSLAYYSMMTNEEKEIWAINHITTKEEILGCGNDYMWYEFVSFDNAFEAIKKYVLVTPCNDKRMKMISVLIDSAKTQREIEALLDYFYKRHVNETSYHKTKFLDQLISKHNVLNFDENCWKALENIFHNLGVYSSRPMDSHYRAIAFIYYVINKKAVPSELNELITNESIEVSEIKRLCRELKPEKEEMVFQYIHKFYMQKVESSARDVKSIVRYISLYLDLLNCYSKTEDDIAENMNKYITVYRDQISNNRFLNKRSEDNFCEKNIMRFMKKDATLVIDEFPAIKRYIETRFGRTNWLLKKLKIYFEHDIAKKYLQLLNNYLSNDDVDYHMTQVAVYGIFKLADESFKIEFMKKHEPTNIKIDHAKISPKLLKIQQAICSYSCISRPPIPLTSLNHFLVGDYVHYCLPMFNNCLMNLPLPVCINFVETLIDKPISIQKHGLRLAFQCFSTDNLSTLLNRVWKRTKNVSMRKILYKSLFDKVLIENDKAQLELFELLVKLTLDLDQDDDDELFRLLSHHLMPYDLKGQYLVSGWRTVKKLPESSVNLERKTRIINTFENYSFLIPEEEIISITNDHVNQMLDKKEILNISNNSKNGLDELILAKWKLTVRHLTNVNNEEKFKLRLEVVKHIIKKCLEMRNEVCDGKFVVRQFYMEFVRDLDHTSHDCDTDSYPYMKMMFATILGDLAKALSEHEIFTLTLEISLSDITRDIIAPSVKELLKKPDIHEIEVVKTGINKYAERYVEFLKMIMQNGKYFPIFREQIKTNITEQLERVNSRLGSNIAPRLNPDDLSVILCTSLLNFEITEIYLLILELLPLKYCGVFSSEYNSVLVTVKAFNNDEVQFYMFQKFVNSDFLYRPGIIKF